ncbi:helix-turn-helix transcriptional regulator [Pseudomonas cavernae]|uniref:Helix-turn-helix transcriptional regulator n=1 Tax=Pseudomonas cavernae TaxID=2320867 RepID=A0A385YY13_9PSED|nr:LuxR C-terminal-related transcriptional regulator [Pseudomonas cavernae]AYC31835.1 helix-turn-helix transcriptional regulator [Pseudomonas cavernae]
MSQPVVVASRQPRLPVAHVPRPRLYQPLLASDCRLNLICAPAGFGKSVLLSECARQIPSGTRLLWLDLGGRALSPAGLLERLAGALRLPVQPGEPGEVLAALLERVEQRLWIVLDDYPRQPCAELDDCLDRLFDHIPPNLRWFVACRRRPNWNLPRLLLLGELLELDAQTLALDAAELHQLLAAHGLKLPAELEERLLHDYEGWPAVISLLLLKTAPAQLHERLLVGTALLREYLDREVLNGLTEALREALLMLAHLPRFSEALGLHLLATASGEVLDELRNRQLLIGDDPDSSGEQWRLWRPLAHCLQRVPGAAPAADVHQRAAQWLFEHGQVREAIDQALAADLPDLAAGYLLSFDQKQLLIERSASQFLQWRDELPRTLFASSPRLIFMLAWTLLFRGRLDEVDECLTDLVRFLPQADSGRQMQLLAEWQAVQGALHRQRGLPAAREYCLAALAALAPASWAPRMLCMQTLAQHALAIQALDQAEELLAEGVRQARLNGSLAYEALLNLDRIHLLTMRGDFVQGLELVDQSMQQVAAGMLRGPVMARLRLLRGALLIVLGRAEEARVDLREGMQEAERYEDVFQLFGYFGLAEMAAEAGDTAQAAQLLQEGERLLHWLKVPEVRYRGMLELATGALNLRLGDLPAAREVLCRLLERYKQQGLLAPSGFYGLLPRAHHRLALVDLRQGQVEAALAALVALRDECLGNGQLGLACECRFSLAEALLVAGRAEAAEQELRLGLAEAQRMRMVRPLQALFARQPELLLAHASEEQQQLLLRARLPADDSGELLSARELEVLRLIAAGLSNQEIAARLFISLHTVKTHAHRINAKLKVERRTQAVAQAKLRGLLEGAALSAAPGSD